MMMALNEKTGFINVETFKVNMHKKAQMVKQWD